MSVQLSIIIDVTISQLVTSIPKDTSGKTINNCVFIEDV